MKISVRNRCSDFNSYRAARVKSLFNAESGCDFSLDADLPIDDGEWRIGVVVGPSGSGKTSIGKTIWPDVPIWEPEWPADKPIVEAIAPDGDFDAVTASLAAVGLGSVPAWLRPHGVLSNGEKFRANMARLVAEAPPKAKLDEFTSVVDRQIARFGALAFQKAWRRTGGQCLIMCCHYDVIDWLEPDWVYDTATGKYSGRGLWRRPKFELEIHQTNWRYWPLFEPHHYLKLRIMPAAKCYVGTVDGELVCHLGVGTSHTGLGVEARACRMVVLPEWQGAGVGLRFLNQICEWTATGADGGRIPGRRLTTLFHTSHPGLCAALRRSPGWRQTSAKLYGQNKARSHKSMVKAGAISGGFGGHFRAVQGFRYYGKESAK